jgi:hypothetical protein
MATADLLYDDTYRGPRYTYGLRYRPLGYAQVPPGWIIRSDRPHPEYPHGTVDYPRPLSPEEARGYELTLVAETAGGPPDAPEGPPAR